MALELPDYSELNSQQAEMINLPENRNYVIKGSPGARVIIQTGCRAAN